MIFLNNTHTPKKKDEKNEAEYLHNIKRSYKASGKCSHILFTRFKNEESRMTGTESGWDEGMVFAQRIYKWGDNNLKPEIIQISLLAAVLRLLAGTDISDPRAVAVGFCGLHTRLRFGCARRQFSHFRIKFELIKFTAGSCV